MEPEEQQGTIGRILVVDDSPEARSILCRLLAFEGFETYEAENGQRALSAIPEWSPDLVLLDVMMPQMDGLTTLEHIRQTHPASSLPVIMVTALGSTHDVVDGLERGANDYITKPPQFEILAARVRTQLRLKHLEDQRRKTIEQMRELNAMKDKFLQIAAHDLRNPLNNIIVGTEMVRRIVGDQVEEDLKHVLSSMRTAGQMMVGIVNDFLDLGAMQAGRLELRLDLLNLNETVEGATTQFNAYAAEKQTALELRLSPEVGQITGDAARIAQVTANLVSNAIKFSPTGARVVVRTRLEGDLAYVEVVDNGPGIAEEELPLLFQDYARLSNKPTGGERSSGVGLSIARRMIELHGGRVGVRSKVGVGSMFWMMLPVAGPEKNSGS